MELGLIGLGKMGRGMTARLVRGGHRVVAFDLNAEAGEAAEEAGAEGAAALDELVSTLETPRAVWVMVPAGDPTDEVIGALAARLDAGDLVIDGGNANYNDSMRRAEQLAADDLLFVDAGTSGGVWGEAEGYSLMVGGTREAVERLRPALETLAPAPDRGWGHVGPAGAGHFVKMIHNGIEYGLMQAYTEGFALLERKEEFDLDLHQVAELWRYGSVVRSWLLDLTARALEENPALEGVAPYVEDSGEGRWTVSEAIDQDIAAPVITLALLQRLQSREETHFSEKLLAALRHQFGGHAVRSVDGGS